MTGALVHPPSLETPVTRYLAGLSAGSRPAMAQSLTLLAELAAARPVDPVSFPWHELRAGNTLLLRAAVAERYAPNTARRHVCALRGVLREARRMRLLSAEDYADALDLPRITGERPPAGRALTPAELAALFTHVRADRSLRGQRDGALLAVAVGGGLREAELTQLGRLACVAGLCLVEGKGRRHREQPLPPWATEALSAWLAASGPHVAPDGPVFVAISRRDHCRLGPITPRAVAQIVSARATAAGLVHTTPHDLRRTYGTSLLDQGHDLSLVSALMGHASVTTTQRYDRRSLVARQRAIATMRDPAAT